jgi:hypothetical protein
MSLLAGPLASTACASKPPLPVPLKIPLDRDLRKACERSARPSQPLTDGALTGFSIRQEGAITQCERVKNALVAIIDQHNAAAEQLQTELRGKAWRRRGNP